VQEAYIDQSEDIYLRAGFVADLVAYDQYIGKTADISSILADTIIVFERWEEGQRSYWVYGLREDGTIYQAAGGYDYMVDLTPSYTWLTEKYGELDYPYDFAPEEKLFEAELLEAEQNEGFSDFVQLMDEGLTEEKGRSTTWRGYEIGEWYESYNGEQIQVVENGYKGGNIAGFQGIVYYRAEADEEIESVVVKMLNAAMETLTVESEDRTFVVTDYYFPEQELQSWDSAMLEMATACWQEFGEKSDSQDAMKAYIDQWIAGKTWANFYPIPDDMWYFIPAGYYRFEGFDLGSFREEVAEQSGPEKGMVGFWNQGSDETQWTFLLMKYDNVYRLQNMSRMNVK
jgi:hypothetical protein